MLLTLLFLIASIRIFLANGQAYNCDFDTECPWMEGSNSHGIHSTYPSYNASINGTGLFVVFDSILSGTGSDPTLLHSPLVISTVSQHCSLKLESLSDNPHDCKLEVFLYFLYNIEGRTHIGKKTLPNITSGLNRWEKSAVYIGAEVLPFYLTIETLNVGNETCYLAVDNIVMSECQPADLPYSQYCTFDDNSTCGWRTQGQLTWQLHQGPLIWQLHEGPATSDQTLRPSADHTSGTPQGFYMYVEGDTTVPFEIEPVAELYSQIYLPPPSREKHQPLCQVTFAYYQYWIHARHLSLSIDYPCSDTPSKQMKSTFKTDVWKVVTVNLNLTDIDQPFRLWFSASKDGTHGEFALDDISLSPECFGFDEMSLIKNRQLYKDWNDHLTDTPMNEQCPELMEKFLHIIELVQIGAPETKGGNTSTYEFSSCGAKGRFGPSQKQCDAVYINQLQTVFVRFGGVQTWTVPEPGQYSITVVGASGGHGAQSVGESRGAYVHGKFNFSKGQKIHVIVGQEGWNACSKPDDETKQICGVGSSSQNTPPNSVLGGGGGGGGASYVFIGDLGTDNLTLLLVAGGGGGLAYNFTQNDSVINGGWGISGPGVTGQNNPQGAGGGGGWTGKLIGRSSQTGHGILYTRTPAQGGESCPNARQQGWISSGGFGGGGGGCLSGGGGGGYTGGNASRERTSDYALYNGIGGTSYISAEAEEAADEEGIHKGPGSVEFHLSVSCSCSYLCVVTNVENRLYDCLCPAHMSLDKDGHTCIDDITPPMKESSETGHIVLICSGVLLIFVLLTCVTFIVHYRRRKAARRAARENSQAPLNLTSDTETGQGQRPLGRRTEVNLYYDFVGTDIVTQDLVQIPRDDITLTRALGQGAFGEVYEGILINFSRDKTNMAVAVKTLPAISTQQAKLDFLMEAVIISKFKHPNIVHFIGICMDKHPGFIILELLEGGDLKTFLRESRRKGDVPCPLSMKDLLKLALDVAQGCKHLEQDHFIHRDIAARNCLLTSKGPNRVAKIADFGMARDIYRADYYKKGGRAMLPVKWMPPEAFMDGIFTSKTDVWSFGVLLWEVFSMGLMPYPCRSNQDVMEYVNCGGRMDAPDKCPSAVTNLMMICWHVTPERRPSFVSLIKKLNSCLQNEEVLRAPVASNPVGTETYNSGGTLSSSSTTPLLSQQTSEPHPESPSEDQEDISKTHRRAFSKLNGKGYRSVPLSDSDGRETTSVCPNKRGRLSVDFTTKPDFVALIPAVVSGSSPNITATTGFNEQPLISTSSHSLDPPSLQISEEATSTDTTATTATTNSQHQ